MIYRYTKVYYQIIIITDRPQDKNVKLALGKQQLTNPISTTFMFNLIQIPPTMMNLFLIMIYIFLY